MSIDKGGSWWIGSEPRDIQEYLEVLTRSQGEYVPDEFRMARCPCGADAFKVFADPNEGAAQRLCPSCGESHFVCDSEEYWDEAEPEAWSCVQCSSDLVNVGVGFSLYDDQEGGVRWLHVGVRCASCGVLGRFADWKVAYAPSLQLLDRV